MPKPKKQSESRDLLAAFSPPERAPEADNRGRSGLESETAAQTSPPSMLEYTPMAMTERWQVEKFDLLVTEFSFFPGRQGWERVMASFQESVQGYQRGWRLCCQLFGIGPVVPRPDTNPDDIGAHSRAKVCEMHGLEPKDLQAELDAVRTLWAKQTREAPVPEVESNPSSVASHQNKGELQFGNELLREFGFAETMFTITIVDPVTSEERPRQIELNRAERDWFCNRLKEWEKMLREPMAQSLTRETLLNELFLRRIGQEMGPLSPSSGKWQKLSANKASIEAAHAAQVEKLQVMFPEMETSGRVTFRGVLTDVFKAHQDYYARGDRRLADRIFTATEIEVLLRPTVQRGPQYRIGLNMAILEAMHNLHDPDFRPQFKPPILKMLEAGFRGAVEAMREKLDVRVVDLEKGVEPGEGDDFEDLIVPEEKKAEG